ncbi:hypothetical protein MNBD_UNCLBAC01-1852 [hydrothermal vent metagenome]|uniref:Lipoprotein n=1 Tax=hydrothermal vent metagenome TaxID=652676 RepID=A0A3B1DJL5_9ZZZZ
MHVNIKSTLVVGALMSIVALGCSQPTATNSQDAIEKAKAKQTVEAKVSYLVKEANAFVSKEKFDEGVKTAKYILSNLDENSSEAKNIIEQAKTKLKAFAEKKAEELKTEANKKLGDVKGKIGSLGK